MKRVEEFIMSWYELRTNKYNTLENKISEWEEASRDLTSLYTNAIVKYTLPLNQEGQTFIDKSLIELNKITAKINEMKEELRNIKVFLSEDLISTYIGLNYLDNEIKNNIDLKSVIIILLDEMNEYAKATHFTKQYNKSIDAQKQKREYDKKVKSIDALLLGLPPISDGFYKAFESTHYDKKDLKLRDNLVEYKKKLEEYKNKKKHKDLEYYRNKSRSIMDNVHNHFNIINKETEKENFIKGLRPILFK